MQLVFLATRLFKCKYRTIEDDLCSVAGIVKCEEQSLEGRGSRLRYFPGMPRLSLRLHRHREKPVPYRGICMYLGAGRGVSRHYQIDRYSILTYIKSYPKRQNKTCVCFFYFTNIKDSPIRDPCICFVFCISPSRDH